MVDLKNIETRLDPQKEVNRTTENIHSSMYGQNRKHNSINKPGSGRGKSLDLDPIHRTHSSKNLPSGNHILKNAPERQRSRPSSLLVTKEDVSKAYLRSRSVDEPGRKNGAVLSCIRSKFSGDVTPASSVEKLARLKERLLSSGVCDGEGDGSNRLDSDDESTPLVSDLSTPSASASHNSAFSPQSDKLSTPSPDKNRTDSTEYSPVSPVRGGNSATVSVSSVCNVVPGRGSPPHGLTGSEVSLSFYLEAANKFSNSSLASVASFASDRSGPRTVSGSSGISRQNAIDPDVDTVD